MDLLDLVKARRSTRVFESGRTVPEEHLEKILEAARWAPSARNLQPLEFVIVGDPKTKERLAEAGRQSQPIAGSCCIVVVGDEKRVARIGELSSNDLTTAEAGINELIYQDAAAAIQNMLLQATELGINSLWIGSFDRVMVSRVLGIDKNFKPIAMVVLGYKAAEPLKPPKRGLKDRVHREKFRLIKHDEEYVDFYKKIEEFRWVNK